MKKKYEKKKQKKTKLKVEVDLVSHPTTIRLFFVEYHQHLPWLLYFHVNVFLSYVFCFLVVQISFYGEFYEKKEIKRKTKKHTIGHTTSDTHTHTHTHIHKKKIKIKKKLTFLINRTNSIRMRG